MIGKLGWDLWARFFGLSGLDEFMILLFALEFSSMREALLRCVIYLRKRFRGSHYQAYREFDS